MACDHEHVSAGEKETKKPVKPLARNTDNFSILSFVLSRSTLHFRVHILIRKVCRIVSETSVFRLDHVARSVEERTFPINRAVFSKSVPSWLEWTNRVCLSRGTWAYISEDFDLGTFPRMERIERRTASIDEQKTWKKRGKEKGERKKKIGVRMVDRVRKGKINAGGRRTPRKFDFLATPDVSMRFVPFFFLLFERFLFSEPTGNNNGRKRVKSWWRDRERRRRISRFHGSSARTDRTRTASSRWIWNGGDNWVRSLTDSIVIETEDAWNGFRNGYFSPLLSRISTEKRDVRDSSLRVKRELEK